MKTINPYLSGKKLYGDDFSIEEIKKWYEDEKEGYANLGSINKEKYFYGYHEINKLHGFSKIKNIGFRNALGFGSAYGLEFEPIIKNISKITIIEPSENLRSEKVGHLIPTYIKPTLSGTIDYQDNNFDLITCFGTLHHIPNVTHILSEFIRITKPNGFILIREPIHSMGDWSFPRNGLTKHERGIPLHIFESFFKENSSVKVVSKEYCFTTTAFLQRRFGKLFKKPIYSYRIYVLIDKYLSKILKFNSKYHADNIINKIAPTNIFYVLKKL